ncbi:hypothetical protein [uncultured Corynebacterium sp.]|uniref:hypothetical protein n=1 Tax=uncultured Corynebacterium sp. TaxID=159447 RepID=UPI0025957CD2|nr:hypothetical protein [uncultured Corynebacterium sp.]
MANPAKLLLDIFESWHNPDLHTRSARDDEDLSEHRRAMRYIVEIEQILDLLDAEGVITSVYRRYLSEWVAIVLNYPHSWTNSWGDISVVAREHLVNLANQSRGVVPEIDTGKFKLLSEYLDSVEHALASDETLPQSAKNQVQTVIENIRTAMDNITVVGDLEFQDLIRQLFSLVWSADMRSQKKEKWEACKDRFVWPFLYDAMKYGFGYGVAQIQGSGAFGSFTAIAGS